jgi:hypothetical protein
MTLDDLKTKITDPAVFQSIQEMIEAEKSRGIEETQKRNRENSKLRPFKQAIELMGFDPDSGTQLDEWLTTKVKKPVNDDNDTLSLKSLQKELNRVKQERDQERQLSKKNRLTADLTNVLGDKVYGSKYLINTLINDGSVDVLDNEIVFKQADGTHVDFNTGIKSVLESNKDLIKTKQASGTNSTRTNNIADTNIQAIISSKDPEQIAAHTKEIAAALGLKM